MHTNAITKTILGTGIIQYSMDAGKALEIGLLTDGAAGCKWFAEWATARPADAVHAYTFDGIFGGFIYGEVADFETLAEFAQCAADLLDRVGHSIWNELAA